MLTDIEVDHVYKGKNASEPIGFKMHPFRNTHGEHVDKFEILHSFKQGTKTIKRSGHLTEAELAEFFARALSDRYNIRLRVRPSRGDYPDAPPGKRILRNHVIAGSAFEKRIQSVDVSQPASAGLRAQLSRLSVDI